MPARSAWKPSSDPLAPKADARKGCMGCALVTRDEKASLGALGLALGVILALRARRRR